MDGHGPTFMWHDLDHLEPDITYGVLELHERLTQPAQALELHVVTVIPRGTSVAWWVTEDGVMLGMGEA